MVVTFRNNCLFFENLGVREDTAIYEAYEDFQIFDPSEPEKQLMWAVLRTAIEDVRKRGDLYRDARRYFESKDLYYPFSFLNVCYHLNIPPTSVIHSLGLADHCSTQLAA